MNTLKKRAPGRTSGRGEVIAAQGGEAQEFAGYDGTHHVRPVV